MNRLAKYKLLAFLLFFSTGGFSQVDEDKLGAWYMYFWNTTFKDSQWGAQGDIQYRNWNLGGDLEQLLLRGGITYQLKESKTKFTLGYGNITSGAYGIDETSTVQESRIYQEALIPNQLCKRIYLTHRFRFEQRFVENQDFRTRWRYNIFVNVPINKDHFKEVGAFYLAFYNELFINGQRSIGDNRKVELFDRNRTYLAIGHSIRENMRFQLGILRQATDVIQKKQLQLSLHHSF